VWVIGTMLLVPSFVLQPMRHAVDHVQSLPVLSRQHAAQMMFQLALRRRINRVSSRVLDWVGPWVQLVVEFGVSVVRFPVAIPVLNHKLLGNTRQSSAMTRGLADVLRIRVVVIVLVEVRQTRFGLEVFVVRLQAVVHAALHRCAAAVRSL
jgi:hypothetical protein